MTPEELARVDIDAQLVEAGWEVQDYADIYLQTGKGVAVREYPMKSGHGFADYLLFFGLTAVGVIEAKKQGTTLTGVEIQTKKYSKGLPDGLRTPFEDRKIRYLYESTGKETRFTDGTYPYPKSRRVFTFHKPQTLAGFFSFSGIQTISKNGRVSNIQSEDSISFISKMNKELPELDTGRLWPAQIEAVRNLEESIRYGRRRHLIQMATGSGKTYTSIMAAYRMIQHGGARCILFLVDRSNLGRQALREFQQFDVPGTGRKFTEIWNVQLLSSNQIDPVARVVITTVQRLYSILKGDEEFDSELEEEGLITMDSLITKSPPVVYSQNFPIETFDVLIIDECHRSIYNLWRQVIEYFDAQLVGLTATPSKQTIGFFERNLVMEYGHRRAVADGVNVDYNIYRIRTQIGESGSSVEAGIQIEKRDRLTREQRWEILDSDLNYDSSRLDKDVVATDQIRTVVKTYRDVLPDLFPGREKSRISLKHIPKTLIFAKTDSHADDIVKIVRDEFGKGNDFCQKITYKTTGAKPEEILAQFRNSYNPRIVVTVDMIATGTDVKPLESLIFMRMVRSTNFFEQMKGRGVRVIDSEALISVTPDAKEGKGRFWLIDAAGVTEEHAQNDSPPLERQPSVSFKKLITAVAAGSIDKDIHTTLAGRLAIISRRLDEVSLRDIEEKMGNSLSQLTKNIVDSVDPDVILTETRKRLNSEDIPTQDELDETMFDLMENATQPLRNPKIRDLLIKSRQQLDQFIDDVSIDTLLESLISKEAENRCKAISANFENWIEENKEEIAALEILYQRPRGENPSYIQLKELRKKMIAAGPNMKPEILWQSYATISELSGNSSSTRGGGSVLADTVQLVRHALFPSEVTLRPHSDNVSEKLDSWLNNKAEQGIIFDEEQLRWINDIANHIGSNLEIGVEDFEYTPFSMRGGLGKAELLFKEGIGNLISEMNEVLA